MNLIPDDCNSLLLTWIHFGYTLKYPSARWISLSLSPSFRPMAGQTGGHFEREELVCAFVQLFILYHEESLMIILFFCFFWQGTCQSVMSLTFGSELSPSGMRADHHHFSFFFFLLFLFFLLIIIIYVHILWVFSLPPPFFFFVFFLFFFFYFLFLYTRTKVSGDV